MTINPSMTLNLSEEGNRGRRMGQLNSISTLGTVMGYSVVLIIGSRYGFNTVFILAGLFVMMGAAAMSMICWAMPISCM
jgi:predicted MFS family arabinose efflux permease